MVLYISLHELDCDQQIIAMRKSIEMMKNGMKELEKIYEGELAKTNQEKVDLELELKTQIQMLQSSLDLSKEHESKLEVRKKVNSHLGRNWARKKRQRCTRCRNDEAKSEGNPVGWVFADNKSAAI